MSTNGVGLTRVIEIMGGGSALSRDLGVSRQVVNNWKKRRVPAKYVLTLVDLVDQQVSAEELRPDVFTRTAGPIAGKFDGTHPPRIPPGT